MAMLRFARRYVVIVAALFVLSGCGAPAPFGPTLASPNVIRVCVRQPNIPKNAQWWGLSGGGALIVEDWELGYMQEHGHSIYYFDPYAPPTNVASLPIPYNKLECPPPPKLPPRVLPLKRAVAAKKADEKKTVEAKQAEAKPAEAKPPPRVASPMCEEPSEPGQRRSRSGTARTCVRSRVLVKRGVAEDPPKAMAAVKPPEQAPTRERKPEEYEDWGLDEPDVSGLDPERAKECINGVCHARHKNFKPNGKKQAKPGNGLARSGEGEAPSAGPPKTGKTTVKTRKSPLSRQNNGLTKSGQSKQKTGPKTDDNAPHNARVKKEAEKLRAEGNKVTNGGRQPGNKEEVVNTPGGNKPKRRPDITYETPDGQKRGRNVGRTKADGTPVKREQEALDDLNEHSERPTDFVPYDR